MRIPHRNNLLRTGILLGLTIAIVGVASRAQDSTLLAAGRSAPSFSVHTIHGRSLSLRKLRGSVVLIDFWATWCGPCQMATPMIEKLFGDYHARGFTAVGFSVDGASTVSQVPGFVKQFGMTYSIVTAPDANKHIADRYGVDSYPSQLLIDKHGTVRWSQDGFSYDEDGILRHLIPALLKEK